MKKRILSLVLAFVLCVGMLPAQVFAAQDDTVTVTLDPETVTFSPAETSAQAVSLMTLDEDGKVALKATNEVKWIDRLDLTGAIDLAAFAQYDNNYALGFYNYLVSNSRGGDLLDPAAGEYSAVTFTGEASFEYTGDDAADKEAALAAISDALNTNWSEALAYLTAVFYAFDRDHPEVFWLSGETQFQHYSSFTYSSDGTVTYTQTVCFILRNENEGFDIRAAKYLDENLTVDVEWINDTITSAEARVTELIDGIEEDMGEQYSRYEMLYGIHNYLTGANCYNTSDDLDSIDHTCREYVSALFGGEDTKGPVCEGYARAFKVLCDAAGIPCVLVDGYATSDGTESEPHMWNYVQMDDGKWYAVDVTWDDPVVSGVTTAQSGYENLNYFLVGSGTENNGLTFEMSHPVSNSPSSSAPAFTNGPALSDSAYSVSMPKTLQTKEYTVSAETWPEGEEQPGDITIRIANIYLPTDASGSIRLRIELDCPTTDYYYVYFNGATSYNGANYSNGVHNVTYYPTNGTYALDSQYNFTMKVTLGNDVVYKVANLSTYLASHEEFPLSWDKMPNNGTNYLHQDQESFNPSIYYAPGTALDDYDASELGLKLVKDGVVYAINRESDTLNAYGPDYTQNDPRYEGLFKNSSQDYNHYYSYKQMYMTMYRTRALEVGSYDVQVYERSTGKVIYTFAGFENVTAVPVVSASAYNSQAFTTNIVGADTAYIQLTVYGGQPKDFAVTLSDPSGNLLGTSTTNRVINQYSDGFSAIYPIPLVDAVLETGVSYQIGVTSSVHNNFIAPAATLNLNQYTIHSPTATLTSRYFASALFQMGGDITTDTPFKFELYKGNTLLSTAYGSPNAEGQCDVAFLDNAGEPVALTAGTTYQAKVYYVSSYGAWQNCANLSLSNQQAVKTSTSSGSGISASCGAEDGEVYVYLYVYPDHEDYAVFQNTTGHTFTARLVSLTGEETDPITMTYTTKAYDTHMYYRITGAVPAGLEDGYYYIDLYRDGELMVNTNGKNLVRSSYSYPIMPSRLPSVSYSTSTYSGMRFFTSVNPDNAGTYEKLRTDFYALGNNTTTPDLSYTWSGDSLRVTSDLTDKLNLAVPYVTVQYLNGDAAGHSYYYYYVGDYQLLSDLKSAESVDTCSVALSETALATKGGTIELLSPSGEAVDSIPVYTEVFVNAVPAEGYRLKPGSLTINGKAIAGRSFLATEDIVVSAEFELAPVATYTPTINFTTSNGTVSFDKTEYEAGETVTVTVTPNEGHKVSSASMYYHSNGTTYLTDNGDGTYSFTMPMCDVTIYGYVSFQTLSTHPIYLSSSIPDTVALSLSDENGNVITPSSTCVTKGTIVYVDVTVTDGYQLDSIYLNSTDNPLNSTGEDERYFFVMPSSSPYLYATCSESTGNEPEPAVSGLHFAPQGNDSLPYLYWTAPTGVTGDLRYNVYASTNGGQSWVMISSTSQEWISLTGLDAATYNTFKVETEVDDVVVAECTANLTLTVSQGADLPSATVVFTVPETEGEAYPFTITGLTPNTRIVFTMQRGSGSRNTSGSYCDSLGVYTDSKSSSTMSKYLADETSVYLVREYSDAVISENGLSASYTVRNRGDWASLADIVAGGGGGSDSVGNDYTVTVTRDGNNYHLAATITGPDDAVAGAVYSCRFYNSANAAVSDVLSGMTLGTAQYFRLEAGTYDSYEVLDANGAVLSQGTLALPVIVTAGTFTHGAMTVTRSDTANADGTYTYILTGMDTMSYAYVLETPTDSYFPVWEQFTADADALDSGATLYALLIGWDTSTSFTQQFLPALTIEPTGGDSGSGGGDSVAVNVTTQITGEGKIVLKRDEIVVGEILEFTVTPATGYKLSNLYYVEGNQAACYMSPSQNSYCICPTESTVTICATFEKLGEVVGLLNTSVFSTYQSNWYGQLNTSGFSSEISSLIWDSSFVRTTLIDSTGKQVLLQESQGGYTSMNLINPGNLAAGEYTAYITVGDANHTIPLGCCTVSLIDAYPYSAWFNGQLATGASSAKVSVNVEQLSPVSLPENLTLSLTDTSGNVVASSSEFRVTYRNDKHNGTAATNKDDSDYVFTGSNLEFVLDLTNAGLIGGTTYYLNLTADDGTQFINSDDYGVYATSEMMFNNHRFDPDTLIWTADTLNVPAGTYPTYNYRGTAGTSGPDMTVAADGTATIVFTEWPFVPTDNGYIWAFINVNGVEKGFDIMYSAGGGTGTSTWHQPQIDNAFYGNFSENYSWFNYVIPYDGNTTQTVTVSVPDASVSGFYTVNDYNSNMVASGTVADLSSFSFTIGNLLVHSNYVLNITSDDPSVGFSSTTFQFRHNVVLGTDRDFYGHISEDTVEFYPSAAVTADTFKIGYIYCGDKVELPFTVNADGSVTVDVSSIPYGQWKPWATLEMVDEGCGEVFDEPLLIGSWNFRVESPVNDYTGPRVAELTPVADADGVMTAQVTYENGTPASAVTMTVYQFTDGYLAYHTSAAIGTGSYTISSSTLNLAGEYVFYFTLADGTVVDVEYASFTISDDDETAEGYLMFRPLDWTGSNYYEDPNRELISNWNTNVNSNCPAKFYYGTEDSYVAVAIEDLSVSDGIEMTLENGAVYLHITAFGSHEIIYTDADGVKHVLPVTAGLPGVSFYKDKTASEDNYLYRKFTVTEENNTFYLVPRWGSLDNLRLSDRFAAIAEVEIAEDGSYATVTVTGTPDGQWYELSADLVMEDGVINSDWWAGLRIVDGTPHLMFRNMARDENGNWYEDSTQGLISRWDTSIDSRHIVKFYYGTEDNYVEVALKDLTTVSGVRLSAYEENSEFISMESVGFGESEVIYTDADGKQYTMPVSIGLPWLGYYSESVASEKAYLFNEFTVTDTNKTFYLVPNDGVLTNVTLRSDLDKIADVELAEDGSYATITMTGIPEGRWYYAEVSWKNDFRSNTQDFGLCLKNGIPHLMYHYMNRDENGNWYENTERGFVSGWNSQPSSGGRMKFYFGTEDSYTAVDFANLSVTDANGAATNGIALSETDGMIHLVANDFGSYKVVYTDADGNQYTMPVTVDLPEVGLYTTPTASQASYAYQKLTLTETNKSVYAVPLNGAITSVTLSDELAQFAEVTVAEDGSYAAITVTGTPDSFGYYYDLFISFQRNNSTGISTWGYSLQILNGTPHLMYRYMNRDENGNWYENTERGFVSGWTSQPSSGSRMKFYFGTEDSYTAVDFSALSVTDATGAATNGITLTETDGVIRLGANDFGSYKVVYTDADGNQYTMPVTVDLPEVGLYTTPTASQASYAYQQLTLTETNKSVYVVPLNGAITSVTLGDELAQFAEVTVAEDGSYATITVTGTPESFGYYYDLTIRFQRSGSTGISTWGYSLQILDGTPHLMFRWADWDEENQMWYERSEEDFRSNWNTALGYSSIVRFYYGTEDNCTAVDFANLSITDSTGAVSNGLALTTEDDFVRMRALSLGSYKVVYTDADGNQYTMPVSIGLPWLGYYSESVASEKAYLFNEFTVTDTTKTFYLVPSDCVLTNVTLRSDLDKIADVELAEDGSYATITMTGIPEGRWYYAEVSWKNDLRSDTQDFGLCLKNGIPHLMYRYMDRDENGNWYENTERDFASNWTSQPSSGGRMKFYFGTEDSYTAVDFANLSVTDADGATTNGITLTETDGVIRLGANDFGDYLVVYTDADGNQYTMPVAVVLPEVGFYTTPTASQANFAYYKLTLTETNKSVYAVPLNGAITSVTLSDELAQFAEVTVAEDGSYATITVTGTPDSFGYYYELTIRFQRSGSSSISTRGYGLQFKNGIPHLMFRWAEWDDTNQTWYEQTDNGFRSSWNTALGYSSIVRFYYGTEDNCTAVDFANLSITDSTGAATNGLALTTEDDFVRMRALSLGSYKVVYTDADGKQHTMPVTVGLPNAGFYTSVEPSEETFIRSFEASETNNTFYLVATNGKLTSVSLSAEFANIATATLSEDGSYATITVTGTPDGRWYELKLEYASDKGYTDSWYESLRINAALKGLTRAEVCVAIVNAMGWEYAGETSSFTDVPTTHEAYQAISILSNRGIVAGMGDGTFAPDNTMTRETLATLLCRVLGESGTVDTSILPADVPETRWSAGYICTVLNLGLMSVNADGNFAPMTVATLNDADFGKLSASAAYTVTFIDWDGTILSKQNVPYGNGATAPADPTRDGYEFTGWNGSYTNVTRNTAVYATYKKTSFAVNFYHNGEYTPAEVIDGYVTGKTPVREGYDFLGWSTTPNGGAYWDFANDKVTQDTILYAIWAEQKITISVAAGSAKYLSPSLHSARPDEQLFVDIYTPNGMLITGVKFTYEDGTTETRPTYGSAEFSFYAPNQDVTLDAVTKTSHYAIDVTLAVPDSISNVYAWLYGPMDSEYRDVTGTDSFAYEDLAVGTYYLELGYAAQEGFYRYTTHIIDVDGTSDRVKQDITIEPILSVSGAITNLSDVTFDDCYVELYDENGWWVSNAWADPETGVFALYGVEAGKAYTMRVWTGSGTYLTIREGDAITIGADSVTGHEITLANASDVFVNVTTSVEHPAFEAYLSISKVDGNSQTWITGATVSGESGTECYLPALISEPGTYVAEIHNMYDRNWSWIDFSPVSYTVTVTQEDIDTGKDIKFTLDYSYPANNNPASLTGNGNLVALDRSEAYPGDVVTLSVRYRNNEYYSELTGLSFRVVLPDGIAFYGENATDTHTVGTLSGYSSGSISVPLQLADSVEGTLKIQVMASFDGVSEFLFGTTTLNVPEFTLNAPVQAKKDEAFTVSGQAAPGSTVFIKNADTNLLLAVAQTTGTFYSAEITAGVGNLRLIAQTANNSSDVVTVKVIETEPLVATALHYNGMEARWNKKLDAFSFWQYVNLDLKGSDLYVDATFNLTTIQSVDLTFCGQTLKAVLDTDTGRWVCEKPFEGWGGSGLKPIRATVTLADDTVIEMIVAYVNLLIDPSGVVYDESGNPLEGAVVTLQVLEDGMWVDWDAESYGVSNPIVTGSDGKYGWMVPNGVYRVLVSRDGYKDYDSMAADYVEDGNSTIIVPPPQTDINIVMERKDLNVVPVVSDKGLVSVQSTAKVGDTVTVTAMDNDGYRLTGLVVTDAKGNSIEVTASAIGGYQFVMPAYDVTVSGQYISVAAPEITIVDNGDGTISAQVSNLNESAVIMIALYDGDRMLSIHSYSQGASISVDGATSAKAFLLDSSSSLRPISKAAEWSAKN